MGYYLFNIFVHNLQTASEGQFGVEIESAYPYSFEINHLISNGFKHPFDLMEFALADDESAGEGVGIIGGKFGGEAEFAAVDGDAFRKNDFVGGVVGVAEADEIGLGDVF